MSEPESEVTFFGLDPDNAPEWLDRYMDSASRPRPGLWRLGVDDLSKLNTAGGFVWLNVGPAPFNNLPDAALYQGNQPVGGEVTDIAIDPSGPTDSVIYIATNNGGIWKTTDGGSSWLPTSDSLPSLSMGAVALDPANSSIVYAGSGNLFDGSAGFIKAAGLYKSVDGGKTWFVADGGVFGSTFAGVGINRIVCPAADSLLVGTKIGLFRSIDGGLNFGANAPAFNDGKPLMPGFVTALAMDADPANPNIAWVAIRGLNDDADQARGRPATVFAGGGLFRLTLNPDGSVSPASTMSSALAGVQFGSIVFAQAGPPSSQTLFASVQGQNATGGAVFLNLYTSADGGTTWTALPALQTSLNAVASPGHAEDDQSSYDFTLGVDPQNPGILYAGFKRIWKSQITYTPGAGGATVITAAAFTQDSQTSDGAVVHWDQHELVFSPKSHWGPAGLPTDVWVGCDGGVARRHAVQITNATQATPIVITAANHGFVTGNRVIITNVNGNTAANSPANAPWAITWIDPNTFSLDGSTGNAAYTSGGTAEGWTQLNAGARTHLFNGIDIGRGAANNQQFTYGGMQDNGTPGHRPGDPDTTWVAGIDGDGGRTAVDPAKPDIVYGFVNTSAIVSSDQGASWATSSDKGYVYISGATNPPAPAPIVITTVVPHLFRTGDKVNVIGVNGNTAANKTDATGAPIPWTITRLTDTTFSLDGSTGNGAYVASADPRFGGFAQGRRFGRNLQNPDSFIRCVALVPNGANPATTVFVSEESTLRKSIDGGASFLDSPQRTFGGSVYCIACPDANRVWVGTGGGQVHFSPDGGSSWKDFSPGGSGPVTGIAVDPASLDHVAVVYAGFSGINSRFPTKHCFLTTNNGADWADVSGTEGATTGNLPDLPLHSVAFDDSTVPPTIIVASDAAVLRTANNGATWERLGTGVPQVTCRSLALDHLDTSRSPRLLRLGTYGRSCFELSRPSGPNLAVEANLAFGAVIQGTSTILPVQLLNVGDASINLTSFARTAGDADFDFATPPNLLPLAPGEVRPFGIKFTAAGGNKAIRTATFTVQSPDVPAVQISASGVTYVSTPDLVPRLSVTAYLNFGEVDRGAHRTISVTVANAGLANLSITDFTLSGSSDFSFSAPALPLNLEPRAHPSFDITFSPGTWGGSSSAKLHIASNDPRQPSLDIPVTGSAPFNAALLIGLIVLGAAVAVGGGVAIYEATKKH